MTIIRDFSAQEELERLQYQYELKTITFASAAHEFRNPLNGIIASLDFLETFLDYEKAESFYKTAKSCSELLLFLVRDILDLSQLE